jgi:hypothetical protein
VTGETPWPQDIVIREVHRFEGVSDPDDVEMSRSDCEVD